MVRNAASAPCVVLDVGKTHVKLYVLDERQQTAATHTRDNLVREDGPYPHADTDGIWTWMLEVLAEVSRRFPVDAIAVTTHGATAALVDPDAGGAGLALPILDYEWPGVEAATGYEDIRPPFSETFSPGLPAGLNLGRQLYWQQATFPEAFDRARYILPYAQYWTWRLTGVAVSEVSSLGCHTDLWQPAARSFSSLVVERGWAGRLPRLAPAWETLGPITAEVAGRTGLSEDCRVHTGVHDSNASLLLFTRARPGADLCVVSTGTWVVCMAAGGAVAVLDERRDMLANVDVEGRMVPCIRFMGGREYAEICSRLGASPDGCASEDDVARALSDEAFVLPDFSHGSGPFGGRQPEIRGPVANGTALASLYCALMVDQCLDLLEVEDDVILVGSYLQNPLLCALVAQLRSPQAVLLSGESSGTARGAAQLTRWADATAVSLDPCAPSRIDGLADYARTWRGLAEERP